MNPLYAKAASQASSVDHEAGNRRLKRALASFLGPLHEPFSWVCWFAPQMNNKNEALGGNLQMICGLAVFIQL